MFAVALPIWESLPGARPSARLSDDQEGTSMGDVPQINLTIRQTLDLASRFLSKVDLASLLSKLKSCKPLTPADLKTLELLIVGDAEYFVKYETELDRWKGEIQQLLGEISKLQSDALDVDGLMHLRALCEEVRRVVPPVVYYLDQKERASKFQEATRGPIDTEGYRFLAEIVEQMMVSANG
jgi:hypothetical protein